MGSRLVVPMDGREPFEEEFDPTQEPGYSPPIDPGPQPYRIGKSTPWRRMTDAEAAKVEAAMATVPVRLRMIYDASSYLDSADELFGQLETVIVGAGLTKARAKELLAPEEEANAV